MYAFQGSPAPGMSTVIASRRRQLGTDQALGVGVGARQQEKRAALRAAQRAGDRRAVAEVDSVGDGAALDNSLELVGQRHRRPDATFRVKRDAVGRAVESVGKDPSIGERAVGADGERRQPSAGRLGDDQRRPVRRDDHPVGEVEILRDDGDRLVGVDPRDDAALTCLRSDVRASEVVDHHVAEIRRNDVGKIGERWRRRRRRSAAAVRLSVEAINSDPSGRNPSPDGAWPASGSVVMSPCRSTVCTASPSMSENHNRPSNHRGPSPKQKPLASGVRRISDPTDSDPHLYKTRHKCHAR